MRSRELQTIGRVDLIDLPDFDLENIPAKIDTGANRSALHCARVHVDDIDGVPTLFFHIQPQLPGEDREFSTQDFFKKKIRSSNGVLQERFVIRTRIRLFGRLIRTTFSLTDRREMKFAILLGRRLLKDKFIVDVTKVNLSYLLKQSKKSKK